MASSSRKFNVKNPSQLLEVSKKIKKSWKEKSRNEINKINEKRKNTLIKKYDVDHIMKIPKIAKVVGEKSRKTREKLGHFLPENKMPLFRLYYHQVYKYTQKNKLLKFNKKELDKIGKCGMEGAYQIDHKFSVKQGFINNIPPYIIGHYINLELITWEENDDKKDKCSISKEKLFTLFERRM